MDTRIVRIRKQDQEFLEELDPFERLSLLEVPGCFALAALAPDEEGLELPVGIMVGLLDERGMSIIWLGVNAELQGSGVGEQLLLKAFDMADTVDLPQIDVLISSEYTTQKVPGFGINFFQERLFEAETPLAPEFIGVLGELKSLEYFDRDINKLPKPTPLSTMTSDQVKKILMALDKNEEAVRLCDIGGEKESLDLSTSFVFIDGEEVYGALLIKKIGDCLLPVCFLAESDKERAALILNSIAAAESKFGPEALVQIFPRTGALNEFLKQFFSGKRTMGKILTASVEDYRSMKLEQDEEPEPEQ